MARIKFLVFVVAVWVGAGGCTSEPSVQFEAPQPLGIANETQVSPSIWGTYLSTQDSSFLLVNDQAVVKHYFVSSGVRLEELSEDTVAYSIENGRFVTAENPKGYVIERQTPDSVFIRYVYQDTLFNLMAQNAIRQFKGRYFLNRRLPDNQYEVFCLQPGKRGSLQMRHISDSSDLADLKELGVVKADKEKWVATLNRKDLRKFLRKGGFREIESFVPYKGPPVL